MNPTPIRDRLPPNQRYTDEEIRDAICALEDRARVLRNSLKDSPMKYALESLPELIGDRQYRDLCLAMGIEVHLQPPTGAEFAEIVGNRVLRHQREEDERRQRQRGLFA